MNKRKLLIVLSIIFALIILVSILKNEKKSSDVSEKKNSNVNGRYVEIKRAPKENNITVPEKELEVIKYAEKSLRVLAQKSPTAKKLLAIYMNGRVYARNKGTNGLQVVTPVKENFQFYITANAGPRTGNGVFVGANFHCAQFKLMVINKIPSQFAQGLFLAHELVHLSDCIDGEPLSRPLSIPWLIGERNAHQGIFAILNEYTGNKYREMVQRSILRRQKYLKLKGARSTAAIFSAVPGDVEDIKRVFIGIDEAGVRFVVTQLIVDANIMNLISHYGWGEVGKRATINMLGSFYGQFGFLK